MSLSEVGHYKVVLVFTLEAGMADEEIRRSQEPGSFPNRLAEQPGFVAIELVRIDDSKTMSIQTWNSEADWWNALTAAQGQQSDSEREPRDSILISRDFFGGTVAKEMRQ